MIKVFYISSHTGIATYNTNVYGYKNIVEKSVIVLVYVILLLVIWLILIQGIVIRGFGFF